MRISVAMATYQGERFLEQQLESIAGQSRLPDELVVVDDRSTDATAGILESFARSSSYPVAVHVNDERLGTARNFEAVIRRCTGDVIALADQDDVWDPSKLARLERVLAEPRAPGLVFSDCELVDESTRPLGVTGWGAVGFTARDRHAVEHGDAFRRLVERQHRFGGTVTGATMAFRAQYRDLVLPFPELLASSGKGVLHDAWIAMLVAALAPVETVPALLVRHRQHPGQQIGMLARPRPRDPARGQPVAAALPAFATAREWIGALRDRLESAARSAPRDRAIALLDRWLRHLDARAGLPKGRAGRILPVARELATGRYHACSSGFRSAARDLLA